MGDYVTSVTNATTWVPPFDICDRYWSSSDYKKYRFLSAYDGLPECFLIGTFGFLIMFLIFCIMRRNIQNYRRLAHVNYTESSWTALLFGGESKNRVAETSSQERQGLFSWLPAFFRVTDDEILMKCGRDALQYLTFQKYLITYTLIVSVICLTIVLPLNFTQGNFEGDHQQFGRTTIMNLNPNSAILWIHCSIALVLFGLAIIFMHRFTLLIHSAEYEKVTNTLMISHIPKDKCSEDAIVQHFNEAYPDCIIQEVQFAYDVSHLTYLDSQREEVRETLKYAEQQTIETGQRQQIMPYACSLLCCCKCCATCCRLKVVDQIDFYTEELNKYEELFDAEKLSSLQHPLGIAFVTFQDELMAARIMSDFKSQCCCKRVLGNSTVSHELRVKDWEAKIAPLPDDISWQNLSVTPAVWWIKAIFASFGVLLLVVFLTTPSVFLNEYHRIRLFSATSDMAGNFVLQNLPTLLLLVTSSLVPFIIIFVETYFIGYSTKTMLNYSIMIKVFTILVLMIIILPTMGFSSIGMVIEWIVSSTHKAAFRWHCIFLSSNCAFYVNYMIYAATIGIGWNLLRITELLYYLYRLAFVRSKAERSMVQKAHVADFEYGTWYAWLLSNFTLMMMYSIPCPLITVPGLLYHVMKYYHDRYNIYYVYNPSILEKRIHETAITMVIISVCLLVVTLLCFIIFRADRMDIMQICAIIALVIVTVFLFFIGLYQSKMKPSKAREYEPLSITQLPEELRMIVTGRRKSFLPPMFVKDDIRLGSPSFLVQGVYGSIKHPVSLVTGMAQSSLQPKQIKTDEEEALGKIEPPSGESSRSPEKRSSAPATDRNTRADTEDGKSETQPTDRSTRADTEDRISETLPLSSTNSVTSARVRKVPSKEGNKKSSARSSKTSLK